MPELSRDVLTVEGIQQRGRRDGRQRPSDRPTCRFQNGQDQHRCDSDLEVVFQETVLVRQQRVVERNPQTCRDPRGSDDRPADPRAGGRGGEDHDPGQRQGHMERAADQVWNQAVEDQAKMERHRHRAQDEPE